ncbi:hypothetical protein NIES970_14800 [[Synechococcus] sp. NIES-970]|nr:hypothetical protein NIES970_14800 [[Synechococcus] sp. NIES-970]
MVMASSKRNLSDLLRQEVQQEKAPVPQTQTQAAPKPVPNLARMTKAQLLAHIETLYAQQEAAVPENSVDQGLLTEKETLAQQVKILEEKIAAQQQAIASAEKTIQTLQTDSSEKAKLETELGEQRGLVEKLYGQIQNLEAQRVEAEQAAERTVEEDRALVLARISSYQANLQFPAQPPSSIPDEEIGWFD